MAADPTTANADAFLTVIAELRHGLEPHLDDDEQVLVALAATCIDVAEWGQLPQQGIAHFRGDKPWLTIGLIREQMPSTKLAEMNARMPPPPSSSGTQQAKAFSPIIRANFEP